MLERSKLTMVMGLCCVVASGCSDLEETSSDNGSAGAPAVVSSQAALEAPTGLALNITSDTSIRLSAPNQNFGGVSALDVNRALVQLNDGSLHGAVGPTDYVVSATLRLSLVPDNTRKIQRQLGAHRLLAPWTELGATWQCASDADVTNRRADCSGTTQWTMTGSAAPFSATATATATLPASRTGVVELDVTSDVRAFLTGGVANNGWLLKTGLGVGGEVADLAARESATPPQLVLKVQRCSPSLCDDNNVCTVDSCSSTGSCVNTPASADTSCDDGNVCTLGDVCSAGVCSAGAAAPAGKTCGAGLVCSGTNQCVPANVVINEVESSGGAPGDWIELYNAGTTAVDLSGWRVKDNDDSHNYVIPAGTTLAAGAYFVVEEAALTFGLGGGDSARLYDATSLVPLDAYTWTAHAATTYGRCPSGTGTFTTATSVTKGGANDCSTPPPPDAGVGPDSGTVSDAGTPAAVVINEVESSGGTPGDWIELYNAGSTPADVSGWRVKDNDDTHNFYVIPSGTTIAAGGYFMVEEAVLGFGLGSPDSARLYDPTSLTPVDSYSWTPHATTTYGRCPNGTGAFTTTTASTKGAANSCGGDPTPDAGTTTDAGSDAGSGGLTFNTWPGSPSVVTADNSGAFASNLSGLMYQPAQASTPAILWAVQNGPSKLYRLEKSGAVWSASTSDDWSAGKTLVYPTGLGMPDSEGVTKAEWESPAVYIATERDNGVSSVSRLSVLRFDTSQAGATLTATHEWNLTPDLPAAGANLGLEAITWVPDSYLVANHLKVDGTGLLYDPSSYPDHGTGLFFVGVEQTGMIYAYALDHAGGSFHRIASISSGLASVMDLAFDRDQSALWTYCDNTCGNKATLLRIQADSSAATLGQFYIGAAYNRPSGLADINNEGIAIAPETECNAGEKPFFWSDDSATDTHSLRVGSIHCGPLP